MKGPGPSLTFCAPGPTKVLHVWLMGSRVPGGAVPEPALPSAPMPTPVPARCPPPHLGGQLAAGRVPAVVSLGRGRGGAGTGADGSVPESGLLPSAPAPRRASYVKTSSVQVQSLCPAPTSPHLCLPCVSYFPPTPTSIRHPLCHGGPDQPSGPSLTLLVPSHSTQGLDAVVPLV